METWLLSKASRLARPAHARFLTHSLTCCSGKLHTPYLESPVSVCPSVRPSVCLFVECTTLSICVRPSSSTSQSVGRSAYPSFAGPPARLRAKSRGSYLCVDTLCNRIFGREGACRCSVAGPQDDDNDIARDIVSPVGWLASCLLGRSAGGLALHHN